MADIVAKPISELRQEANTIYEANTRGENTQVRVGGLFQDIVDWLAVNVPNTFVTLMTPLAEINNAQLGAPSNGQGLVYNNGHWQYGDFGGDGGGGTNTVDWNNITNKPNTFIPSTSYALRKIRQGDVDYLQLICTENQQTTEVSSLEWPSGGGGGSLPDNLVYYTLATYGEHFTNKQCINTKILELENLNSSGGHFLWVNPATSNLMFDEKPIVGSGIEWGENTAPANTLPNIVLNGNLYLQQDSNQYGGIFAANRITISDYRLVGEENTYGYLGNRDIWVEDGELHFGNMQVTKTVNDVQMLNVEGEADDLHLEGNHLWLWNTVGEYKIGSGVELPASGGGGSLPDNVVLRSSLDSELWTGSRSSIYAQVYEFPRVGTSESDLLWVDNGILKFNSSTIGSSGNSDISWGSNTAPLGTQPYIALTDSHSYFSASDFIGEKVSIKNWDSDTDSYYGDISFSVVDSELYYGNLQVTTNGGTELNVPTSPGGGLTAATAGGQNVVATGTTTAAIPVADANHYGVIKINPAASLGTNQYPVKLSSGVAYVEVNGGGGGWTPTGGTTSNPKVATGDIDSGAVTNGKLADGVKDTYISVTSLNNFFSALNNVIGTTFIKQLLSTHQYMFWVYPTHIDTLGPNAMFLFYAGTINDCRFGNIINPVLYYTGSTLQVCVLRSGSDAPVYWTFSPSRAECAKTSIQYSIDDVSTNGKITQAVGRVVSFTWDSTPTKLISQITDLNITKYINNQL